MSDPVKTKIKDIFIWDTPGYVCISYKNYMMTFKDKDEVKACNYVTEELIKYFKKEERQ